MSKFYPEPYEPFPLLCSWSFKLCNKNWFKKCDTCWYFKFCIKKNLPNLKTEVDSLDIDKLAPVAIDLSKQINVVKNDVFKKLCIINWLQK